MFGVLLAASAALLPFSMAWKNAPEPDAVFNTEDRPCSVYVLEFYANFCGACNDNASNVDDLATAYEGDSRVAVLDVSLDSEDREIRAWIRNHNPNHPVVQDQGLWDKVNEQYIPTTVITSGCSNGEIVYKHTGEWSSRTKQEIREKIDELLQHCPMPLTPMRD